MKNATPSPKSTPRAQDDDSAPLPHEADQSVESQNDHEPRDVGRQAHEDIERGLVDTDRRGGDDYQRTSQRTDQSATQDNPGDDKSARDPSRKP